MLVKYIFEYKRERLVWTVLKEMKNSFAMISRYLCMELGFITTIYWKPNSRQKTPCATTKKIKLVFSADEVIASVFLVQLLLDHTT